MQGAKREQSGRTGPQGTGHRGATPQAGNEPPGRPQVASPEAFLRPISVKSKTWGSQKVDIHRLQSPNGPFAKYRPKHIIHPPANVLPARPTHTVNTEEAETEAVGVKEVIASLLQPKEYPRTKIEPQQRTVQGLTVELLDHQVWGLKFLKHREKVKPSQRTYLKRLHGASENDRAETFFNRGGILADDMGLGKTVQMISLILSHPSSENKTTLVVCPASLVSQWCSEIQEKAPSLEVLSYHGSKRPADPQVVHHFDVVVTSYQTLSSENTKPDSALYSDKYPFRRVVLDEAHTIKNPLTKSRRACCDLRSSRRWCLTGTPIQNKIDELQAILSFLGVNEYEDMNIWKHRIDAPLNSANPEDVSVALGKLHQMLDKYMLRRTKQILVENNVLTVKKKIHREVLVFTPFEQKLYDILKEKIIKSVLGCDVSLDDDHRGVLYENSDINLSYMSLFTYLLRLRQLCCHWKLLFMLKKQHDEDDDSLLPEIKKGLHCEKSNKELEAASIDDDLGDIIDSIKHMNIEVDDFRAGNPDDGSVMVREADGVNFVGNNAKTSDVIELRRVLNILRSDDNKNPRKTIIFSEFTSMLDILAETLSDNGIKFVRYDGKMSKTAKDETLERMKKEPEIHVLLCSLKCGAYGLNITFCSRVVLYEPFWNPAIGAQAIDRVYRLGQLTDVDVHEFYVADTIEMKIKALQDKKRELMLALVDKDAKSALDIIGNGLSKSETLRLLGL